jgi:hypothetical protein
LFCIGQIPVPILNDNYGYILIDKRTNQAAVVDPADPELIIQMLEARKVTLAMVRRLVRSARTVLCNRVWHGETENGP